MFCRHIALSGLIGFIQIRTAKIYKFVYLQIIMTFFISQSLKTVKKKNMATLCLTAIIFIFA